MLSHTVVRLLKSGLIMSKVNKYIKNVFCIFLILSLFLTTIDLLCFDKNFYTKEYNKLQNHVSIGVSEEDLNTMTFYLLDYLKDKTDNLDIQLPVKGKVREIYNEQEKIHMEDVKVLYQNAILVRNISCAVSIGAFLYLYLNKSLKGIYKSYLKVLSLYGLIFAFIGIMCLIDFNSFWVSFHKLVFSNDLWLFDPRTSILINMVPEQFFYDLVMRIVVWTFITIGVPAFIFKNVEKRI